MTIWKTYVVIYTEIDWFTYYKGAFKVRARSDDEASRKADQLALKEYPEMDNGRGQVDNHYMVEIIDCDC